MKISKRIVNSLVAIALIAGSLVGVQSADATAVCTSPAGAQNSSLVLCSDNGTFTARAPLSETGVLSQTILMNIDPTKMSLSSASQIVAPAGWTIYYYNGSTWSSTAPSTPSTWNAITKVKAVGTLNSQGTANGQQIATAEATAVAPASGAFSASGAGDGWSVFFDNNNHVFNIYHHSGPASIDCHTRTGTTCSGSWPFSVSPFPTKMRSEGYVDNVNHHLWLATNSSTQAGFLCVNITNIASPAFCNGTATASFVALTNNGAADYTATEAMAQSGTRLFTWATATGKVLCLDTVLNNGLGAACPSQPISTSGLSSAPVGGSTLYNYNGNIYASAGTKAICFDALTYASCTGYPITLASTAYTEYVLPDTSGNPSKMCYVDLVNNPCYSFAGVASTRPASLVIQEGPGNAGAYTIASKNPETVGTRVYWTGAWASSVFCWDAALASGAGAACTNWPVANAINRYTVQVDPSNTQCIWTNGDNGVIQAWDAVLGTLGCTSLPSDLTFDASLIIPRMGCSQTDAIASWQNFTLTGPASGKYTSAYLTVTKNDGTAIAGWSNIAITGSRVVDLSTLTPAQSGQQPLFKVHFNNRTGSSPADDAKATVTATGAEPELCITPDIHYSCPTALGPVSSLTAQSVALSAEGTVTLPNSTVVSLTSASTNVSLTTPSLANCTSNLTGVAAGAGGGRGVPGVTVTLRDGSGNPVYLPNSSTPITTVTDANGNYAFNNLAWGAYSVSFPNASVDMTVSNATVTTGGSGTSVASAGVATSASSTLASGVNGVINAAYVLPPIAPSRTQIAAFNNNVVFNPFAAGPATQTAGDPLAATASTTSNLTGTAGATRLCATGQTPNNCTATSVANSTGVFAVNTTTGVITFTPNVGFIGVAPSVTYVITDAASQKTSAALTPVLASPSAAINDDSYGQTNVAQSVSPTLNDTVSTGNGLTLSSVRLCGISPAQTAPGCNLTSLTLINEGTYTVNTTTGLVTFMPIGGFVGTGTPISYQVTDYLAQVIAATITPHVLEPVLVTPTPTVSPTATPTPTPSQSTAPSTGSTSGDVSAKPDFKAGVENTPVTVSPLGNDPVSSGVAKSVKICDFGNQSSVSCALTKVTTADGEWTVNPNQTVTFLPASGFFGKASIGYRVKDAKGKTVWSYITVTIPEKSGLAYTGAGDQLALVRWMFGFMVAGIALVAASRRRR